MAAVELHHGSPVMVDYTPVGAVAAGAVIEAGIRTFVAHNDIAAGRLGAVAAMGGVYKGIQDGTIDNPGVLVYWDDTAGKFTTTATSNIKFGISMPDQAASVDGDVVFVLHDPAA